MPAHARAMIEGKSLAKTAQLCGVHPTTAFRWRHRFLRAPAANKPRSLSGIVEADETFILRTPSKAGGPTLPRAARKRGGKARHPGPYQDNYSCPRRPRPEGGDLRRRPASGRRGFHRRRACRNRHAGHPSDRRRRPADRRFRPPSAASPSTPCPRRANRPPRRRICTSTTSTPITAALSNGSAASTASPPRTCPTISAGDAPSKLGATNLPRQTGSKALSEMGPINS